MMTMTMKTMLINPSSATPVAKIVMTKLQVGTSYSNLTTSTGGGTDSACAICPFLFNKCLPHEIFDFA